jgi:peptidoglycan/LPS O-acetylase OafA/YrhL
VPSGVVETLPIGFPLRAPPAIVGTIDWVNLGGPRKVSHQALSSFIWSVADLLRGDCKQSDDGKVIPPFTVLRRLDSVLEATKAAVRAEFTAKRATSSYRGDIDGLRGLAVLAVVGFHAFPSNVRGGFVGVDMFFVISGYLITRIIVQDLDGGSFSFREFYYRRIRRLFPALLLVLAASYALGWFHLLAPEFEQFGSHVAAGSAFSSNFLSWHEAGYFDNAEKTKPLLHLWSLGIEEQFYIFWPLLLWLAWKFRLRFIGIAAAVAASSFVLNIIYVHHDDPTAAFYSPAARFWELMLGAILASAHASRFVDRVPFRNSLSIFGIASIVVLILVLDRTTNFPGWWALVPAIGAVLIIGAGEQAWFNRVALSHPALVFVGLISYPLYLWHWPLLSFSRIMEGQTPSLIVRSSTVLISFVLAYLTYRLVERPIRFSKSMHDVKRIAALCTLMLVFGIGGLITYYQRGLPSRVAANPQLANKGEIGHGEFYRYMAENFHPCTPDYIRKHSLTFFAPARCVQSRNGDIKDIAIIGDSHAENLFIGVAEQFPESNIVTYIQSALPLLGRKDYDEIFDYMSRDKNISTVILAGYWELRLREVPAGSSLEAELARTVRFLVQSGKNVDLVDDTPNFSIDPTVCKYKPRVFIWNAQREPVCSMNASFFRNQQVKYRPALVAVAASSPNVRLVETEDAFCDEDVCSAAKNGVLFFRDQDHLTVEGSQYLGRRLKARYGDLVFK